VTGAPLKARFCGHFQCPESDYERRALSRCLYFHARLLSPFFRLLNPSFFDEDRKLIHYLGDVTVSRDAMREVLTFQDSNLAHPTFMRTYLRVRASGRKAKKLAETLFALENK
jgi:hypothetical protein